MALDMKSKITGKKKKEVKPEQILGEGRSSRLIRRWTSSIWKLLWQEYLIYVIIFIAIYLIYRFALNENHQTHFENFVKYIRKQESGLPLTFMLGFYVSLVVGRWWSQYCAMPWPDDVATFLASIKFKEGAEEHGRIVRRTIVRYCILSWMLCIRRLSIKLRKAYPTTKDIVATGLVTEAEADRIGQEDSVRQHGVSHWWMPLQWCSEIATNDEDVSGHGLFGLTIVKLTAFRASLTEVLNYGHVPIPLVYSQVVTLAVRLYFFFALISHQWIKDEDVVNLHYPVFLSIQFMFYFGWLRVAETLYNPFGEDDDDFALEELINRHMKVAFNIVDKVDAPPTIDKDAFWGLKAPKLVFGSNENGTTSDEKIELLTYQEKRDPMI